jgi:hypothetical protein
MFYKYLNKYILFNIYTKYATKSPKSEGCLKFDWMGLKGGVVGAE